MTVPDQPTAHPFWLSRKDSASSESFVPVFWGVQVCPPSVVCSMVPV